MIKLNEDFEIGPCFQAWCVNHYRDGVNPKTKEPTRKAKQTYHSNLGQCLRYIIDKQAIQCASVSELVTLLDSTDEMTFELERAFRHHIEGLEAQNSELEDHKRKLGALLDQQVAI